MLIKKLFLPLFLTLLTLAMISCNPAKTQNEKRYPIAGKVIGVNKTERTATIEHEAIPGYMDGMTMDFNVKNDGDLDRMKPGDRISGTLVVTDDSSWIEITAITEGGSQLT